MLQQVSQRESRGLKWICQAVSPLGGPSDLSASYDCGICGHWLCAANTKDEAWHHSVLKSNHNFSAFPSAYGLMMIGHAFPLKRRKTSPRSAFDTPFLDISLLNQPEAGRLS